jgi:hypothetical protein
LHQQKAMEKKENYSFEDTYWIMKEYTVSQHMPLADIWYFTKLTYVNSGVREILFFAKHEKKGRCFFAKGSKTVRT